MNKLFNWKEILAAFLIDLKSLLVNPIVIFIFVASLFFPSLYAWVGVMANFDPYSNLSNLPVAVVNEDIPASSSLTGEINAGEKLIEEVKNNDTLKFLILDKDEAVKKVSSGEAYCAFVIPENFSDSIVKLTEGSEKRDKVVFQNIVNERENPVAVKISDTGAGVIEKTVNERIVAILGNFITNKANYIASNVINLSEDYETKIDSDLGEIDLLLDSFKNDISDFKNNISTLQNDIQSKTLLLREKITSLYSRLDQIKQNANTYIDSIDQAKTSLWQLLDKFKDIPVLYDAIKSLVEKLNAPLDDAKSIANNIIDICSTLNNKLYTFDSTLKVLSSGLDVVSSTAQTTTETIDFFTNSYKKSLSSLRSLIEGGSFSDLVPISGLSDVKFNIANNVLDSPVDLEIKTVNHIEYYGTAIAPFFASITFWVCGFILISLFRTEVKSAKKKNLTPRDSYLTRLLLFMLIALVQGAVCCLGHILIGIDCNNPLLYILTGGLSAATFVGIVYTLAACFRHVGKGLGVVFICLQIPSCSGMYPVEIMPEILSAIKPFIPFTYSINALRECLVNTDYNFWLYNIFILFLMFIGFMFLGLVLKNRLVNVIALFEKEISKSEILECEEKDHVVEASKSTISNIEAILESNEAFTEMLDSSLSDMYAESKKRSLKGIILLIVSSISYFALISIVEIFVNIDANTKMILLFLWVLLIVALATYVVFVEYKKQKLIREIEKKSISRIQIASEFAQSKN